MAAYVGRDADTGHSAEPCADFLDSCHERVGQQHRPEHRESKLSAYLRVGRDAAGVVVGSTRYDAGT